MVPFPRSSHIYIYHAKSRLNTPVWGSLRSPNYIPPPLTVHFSMTRSVRYQPILHTLYYTLHTEHAYCLSYRYLNNVDITTVIEMAEMVETLDGRLVQRSVERVRYVINNLLHLVIVKYGDISLVLCISTLACGSWQYCRYSWNISSYSTLTRVISLIGESGSTLYVGLSGIVRNLIQKSTA